MATDIKQLMVAKSQMEAMLQAEIRQTARDIFVKLVTPYLENVAVGRDKEAAPHVKRCADLAWKAAPYLHQAAGMVSVDDDKHWGAGI